MSGVPFPEEVPPSVSDLVATVRYIHDKATNRDEAMFGLMDGLTQRVAEDGLAWKGRLN